MVKIHIHCSLIACFVNTVCSLTIVSDRDPCFIGKFWKSIIKVLGTRLDMSTADHSQTDGQTERVNRVLGDVLRSVCAETHRRWS